MFHGRLLLAGSPTGVVGLNSYDAVAMAWAYMDEVSTRTEFTYQPQGQDRLRDWVLQRQVDSTDELAEMRERMSHNAEAKAAKKPSRPRQPLQTDPSLIGVAPAAPPGDLSDLEALQARMGGGSKD